MAIEKPPVGRIEQADSLKRYRPPQNQVSKYHVVTKGKGETLVTVAQANNIKVEQLVAFNFPGAAPDGKIVSSIVNWYLHHHVEFGCPETRNRENRWFRGGEKLAIPIRVEYIDFRKPLVVTGPYTGKLVWKEVDPKAPNLKMGGSPAKDRTSAVGDAVQYIFSKLGKHAINSAIQREFKKNEKTAINALRGHKTGGILAFAHIINRYNPQDGCGFRGEKPMKNFGATVQRFDFLTVWRQVYALPKHAISVQKSALRKKKSVILSQTRIMNTPSGATSGDAGQSSSV